MAKYILDTRLGRDHYVICTEAIRRGVIEPEDLNEGRRTLAEQWHFYRNQPPRAAFPSPNAPHIWVGRNNHAIDGNSMNGAVQRLAQFYRGLGINVVFNVPGENWHFQPTSGVQLRVVANKILQQRDKAVLKKGERDTQIKFFKHQLHFLHDRNTKRPYFRAGSKPKEGWDSKFSEELQLAVKAFQRDYKLPADGVIGPKTDRKIDRAYSHAKRRRKSARIRAKERSARASARKKS